MDNTEEAQKRFDSLMEEISSQKMDDFFEFIGVEGKSHSLDERPAVYYLTELSKLEAIVRIQNESIEKLAKNQEIIKNALLVLVDRIDPVLRPQMLN